MEDITQLLNYCATHPNAVLRFIASNMTLHTESDASYLTAPKARSRGGGYFYLSDKSADPTKAPLPNQRLSTNNRAIDINCHIMRKVLSSATEAKLGALFHNGKEACSLRITLEEMGHPQPPTPIATDNLHAMDLANCTLKNNPKPPTCNFIGSATLEDKANSLYIGAEEVSTKPIISPKIILLNTINKSDPRTYTNQTLLITLNVSRKQKKSKTIAERVC